jgi:hypothetical protein
MDWYIEEMTGKVVKREVERDCSVVDDADVGVEEIADPSTNEVLDSLCIGLKESVKTRAGGTINACGMNGLQDRPATSYLGFDETPPSCTRVGIDNDHVVLGA